MGTACVGVPLGQGGCEAGSGAGRVHGGLQRALSQQPAPWRARPPAGAKGPPTEHAEPRDEELDLPLLLRIARERVERHEKLELPTRPCLRGANASLLLYSLGDEHHRPEGGKRPSTWRHPPCTSLLVVGEEGCGHVLYSVERYGHANVG